MTKNNWLLIFVLIALIAVYAIYFSDWFRPKSLHIFHVTRNVRVRMQGANGLPGLQFGLNRPLRLKEIKVVQLSAWETNKHVLPLWNLTTTSNSIPLKLFAYGQYVPGLKPAIPGARPQPLETNVVYRLFVTAESISGQHDFELK